MKTKSTYQLKRSADFKARLFFMFFAMMMTAASINSCNGVKAAPAPPTEHVK